jgi:serine/threonine protein kinase
MPKIGKKTKKLQKLKTKFKNKSNKTLMKGGNFLGQGSFGCVISPALQCNQKSKKYSQSYKRYSIPRDDVSKIISRTDDDKQDIVDNEIAVSNKLKHIDPNQKYFLYIKENCKIRNIPKDRSNVASVRFLDDESLEIQVLDKKKLDKYHCEVDLKLEPRNLILSNGGKELGDVLHINAKLHSSSKTKYKSDYSDEIEMTKLFYKKFKHHAHSLLQGLYKLHQNNIAQRDIKIENLMIDWTNQAQNDVIVRYIDFGFSEILTPQYVGSKYNIHAQGTPELIPLDITIASHIKNYYRYDKEYILSKIYRELENGVRKTFIDLHLDTSIIKPKTHELMERIYQYFTNGTILTKYFGHSNDKFNGYVQKSDVYALGITFYEIQRKYCHDHSSCSDLKNNTKLTHLIKNMIELDPEKRYNVIQCLQHPYFH